MANQNLSQFGEKLFVADADHTFIWDSAALISKRVSRNSWLNSGTLTSDAPVTISQTWNGTGSTVFKALVVNATTPGTTSSGDSLVADFQVGGVSQLRVHKSGGIGLNNLMAIGGISGPWFMVYNGSTPSGYAFGVNTAGRLSLPNTGTLEWASFASGTPNTVLLRDGADNTLALRNGETNQKFHVYATYSNASNYRRCVLGSFDGANFDIQTEGLGTGAAGGALNFGTAGARRMTITTAGNVGIGTTAPTAPLDVVGGIRFNSIAIARSASIAALPNSTTGLYFGYDGTGDRAFFTSGTTNVSGVVSVRKPAIFDYSTFTFTRDGINADVFLNSSGNVGIGTTSPTSKLHVALNPAANYTTEKVQFGNVFFGNAVSNYSALWMGGISPALTLTNSNFVLASDGSGTILNSPAGSGITFQVNGTNRWAINTSGHFLAAADNTYDIGASGASRPRNVYVAGAVLSGGMQLAPGGAIQNTAGTGAYFNITSGASRLRFDLGGGVVWNDSVNNPLGTETVGLMRNATGVLEVNSGTLGAFRDVRCRSVIQQLPITTTITPASNGDLVVEATSNTTLTFKLKGTDGTVRTGTITLA